MGKWFKVYDKDKTFLAKFKKKTVQSAHMDKKGTYLYIAFYSGEWGRYENMEFWTCIHACAVLN